MRARRWIENFFLLTGILAIDVWIWSHAVPALYQSWQESNFEREVESATSTVPEDAKPAKQSGGSMGRLLIPRLRLRAMVREGDGEDTLSLALGHITNTAMPGEDGNVGVAGHRDTIFRGLRNIRKNDLIVFETRRGRYTYRVEGTEIVKPDKVSVLKASYGKQLTLVTCYPFRYIGAAPDRFIVKARQVVRKQDIRRSHKSRKAWRA